MAVGVGRYVTLEVPSLGQPACPRCLQGARCYGGPKIFAGTQTDTHSPGLGGRTLTDSVAHPAAGQGCPLLRPHALGLRSEPPAPRASATTLH